MQDFPVTVIILGPRRPPRGVLNTREGEVAPAASLNDIANRMRYSPVVPRRVSGATEGFLEGFSRLSPLRYVKSVGAARRGL